MKRLLSWLNYTPLAEREAWEVERHQSCAPAAVWLRAL
jgi:hypothetical protein